MVAGLGPSVEDPAVGRALGEARRRLEMLLDP